MIVALPGLFSYLFFYTVSSGLSGICSILQYPFIKCKVTADLGLHCQLRTVCINSSLQYPFIKCKVTSDLGLLC